MRNVASSNSLLKSMEHESIDEASEKTITSEDKLRLSRELLGIIESNCEEDVNDSSCEEDRKNKTGLNDMTCKPSRHRKKLSMREEREIERTKEI